MAVDNNSENKNGIARMPSGVLWLRIGGLLVLVIAAVLVLISFLNYSNYRKTYIESNLTRYLVLAKDVRQGIVSDLNIGLHPSEDLYLMPALTEMARRYDGIRYIGVVDESGRPISQGDFPALPAQAWKDKIAATATDTYWRSSDAQAYQIGLTFTNNFDLKAGAVVIGYDRQRIERAVDDMMRKMCVDAVKVLILLTALALAGVYFLTRRFSAELVQVGATLDAMFDAAEPPFVADHMLGEDVAGNINEFSAMSHRVVREIARLEQELLPPGGPGAAAAEGRA
jgi:sensor histidine kinase regulating citrate/malate metabolism